MAHLLAEIRRSPLLWLLVLVPVVLTAHALRPEDHTLLFVLSVAAIVPLAALLSRATESVAARIGDMAGGLLNATLGNLTELLIALAALRAGQYVLVKASIAVMRRIDQRWGARDKHRVFWSERGQIVGRPERPPGNPAQRH